VFTRDEAIALAERALSMSAMQKFGIAISHRVTAVTKIVGGRRIQCVDSDQLNLGFPSEIGSKIQISVETNVRDAEMLRQVIRTAGLHKTPLPNAEDQKPDDPDDPYHSFDRPQHYLPVTLWHDSTIEAMSTARGETIANMADTMRNGDGRDRQLTMAGSVAVTSNVYLMYFPGGRIAWGEATDSEVTASVRARDGRASGWSGQTNRDWSQIQPERVVQEAIDMANRSRGPVRMEPGRHTAILSPVAVGQLVRHMSSNFAAVRNRAGGGPFSHVGAPNGRNLRLGERVFDERITMFTDPNDPLGGDFPFFTDGTPSGRQSWIEGGVLQALSYDPYDALKYGKTAIRDPESVHVMAAPGAKTATVAEMIANCERGFYVNRFSNLIEVDQNSTGLIGSTRDGCFYIKDGKINSPVVNFRIFESPFLMFNRIMAVGTSERVAFGFGDVHGWPLRPIIVPPLMVRDFNFSGMSDAV